MIWGRFIMKKLLTEYGFAKLCVGFAVGFLIYLLLQIIGAAFLNAETLPINFSKIMVFVSIIIGSMISMILINGNNRLIIWAVVNTLVWCTVLWSVGIILFKHDILLSSAVFAILASLIGSVLGTVVTGFAGGKK